MEYIKDENFLNWNESFEAGSEIVGGKGWNLGRLSRCGFNIPRGGVLSVQAYRAFLDVNNLVEEIKKISREIDIDNLSEKTTEEKLTNLRDLFNNGKIPPLVIEELNNKLGQMGIFGRPLAVRSSASAEDSGGASFAGVHESFLNLSGLENILNAVKDCYASLWTTRAVAYRRKMKIADEEVLAAVVIMEMVEAKSAGIAFSCDPRSGREDVIVINANYGLGESVVSGNINPDEYYLSQNTSIPQLIKVMRGNKDGKTVTRPEGGTEFVTTNSSDNSQVLSDKEIVSLGLLVQRVHEALGRQCNQDIEWVFDGREFILVQARPVTVISLYTYPEIKNQPQIWSNCNYRDIMPMVQSTLNWSMMKYNTETLMGALHKLGGYPVIEGLTYAKLFYGRAYLNLSIQQWSSYDAFGMTPKEINETWGGHQPEIKIPDEKPYRGIKGLGRVCHYIKLLRIMNKEKKKADFYFNEINETSLSKLAKGVSHLKDQELVQFYDEELSNGLMFHPKYMLYTASANLSNILVGFLNKEFPGQGYAMTNALLAGAGDITSAQHGYGLVRLAEIARLDQDAQVFLAKDKNHLVNWQTELPEDSSFKQAFQEFLQEFGHRGIYELDLINPRWGEDPTYLFDIIKSTIETADLSKIKEQQKAKRQEVWLNIKKLPFYKRWVVQYLLKEAINGAELREMSKSVICRFWQTNRMLFQEIGSRFVLKGIIHNQGDIYHCALSEIVSILSGEWNGIGLKVLIEERKAKMEELNQVNPPDVIIGEVPHSVDRAVITSGNALNGLGVAAGKAQGVAKIINHPNEGEKLNPGEVMAVPSTDPGWTPLFLKASAIIMETGGYLSHGAIVAREYGVPAVVNIPGLLTIIKDGQTVTVDGDEGKVYLT